jgi:hypothetical protein
MAEVTIQLKDDFGSYMSFGEKKQIEDFLEKYQKEILPELVKTRESGYKAVKYDMSNIHLPPNVIHHF